MIRKVLVLYSVILLLITTILAREPIPSGEFVIGKVLEKENSSVKIHVKEPKYCEGTVTYIVKKGLEVPPKGTIIKAYFVKGFLCDDEQPIINKIEVFRNEKI